MEVEETVAAEIMEMMRRSENGERLLVDGPQPTFNLDIAWLCLFCLRLSCVCSTPIST